MNSNLQSWELNRHEDGGSKIDEENRGTETGGTEVNELTVVRLKSYFTISPAFFII